MAAKCSSGVNEELRLQVEDAKAALRRGSCSQAKRHARNASDLMSASRCTPPRNLARYIGKMKRAFKAKCGLIRRR